VRGHGEGRAARAGWEAVDEADMGLIEGQLWCFSSTLLTLLTLLLWSPLEGRWAMDSSNGGAGVFVVLSHRRSEGRATQGE
jgi:hypothetical protein